MNILAGTITLGDIQWNMILGGFGLFLFGIKFMGDGLKSVAGDKLRDYIDKYTSNPLMAVLIGILITIVLQSSSATTAITIGLVRAGLMKLEQAAGIIMGANIGTTITAFLIGLNVERFALYFVFVGGCIICFSKRKKVRYIGDIIMGFGMMFYGLKIMGDSLKMLKDLPQFIEFAEAMSHQPLLAMLAGTIMTGVIQGSAATIGVVQKIYEAGGMTFAAALPFVFGSNIGTTVTGIFAALGGSLAAKRAAGIHTLFNVVGTMVGMLLLQPYIQFINYLTSTFNISPMMQIAVAHIIFNVTATVLFYPFLKQMCKLIKKIIPGDEPERIEIKIDDMDANMAHQLPSSALNVAKQATLKMGEVVAQACEESKLYLIDGSEQHREGAHQAESVINSLDTKITAFLMKVSQENLNDADMTELNVQLQVIKNLERIGDLSINLSEFFEMVFEDRADFSKLAKDDILAMFDLLEHMLNRCIQIYKERDYSIYSSLLEDENYMDLLEYKARQKHFERMARNECSTTVGGSVYCDILGNLERMADHTCNIARCAIESDTAAVAANVVIQHH